MGLFKQKKKVPKRKNVSQKVRNGTTLQTRDEFFEDHNNYKKDKYKNKPNIFYREVTVVDSNRNDELAVIKHQSSGKFSVKNNVGQDRKYNTYIKTKDDTGKPIKVGNKFRRANHKYDVSKKDANKMKCNSLNSSNKKINRQNKKALRNLKGRKK